MRPEYASSGNQAKQCLVGCCSQTILDIKSTRSSQQFNDLVIVVNMWSHPAWYRAEDRFVRYFCEGLELT